MIAHADRLRIRMLSYASNLLTKGINKRNLYADDPVGSPDRMVAHATVEIARELLEILNDTKEVPNVRHRRHL
jgi:hypothetical protein